MLCICSMSARVSWPARACRAKVMNMRKRMNDRGVVYSSVVRVYVLYVFISTNDTNTNLRQTCGFTDKQILHTHKNPPHAPTT